MFVYNKNQNEIMQLTNVTTSFKVNPDDELGILGVFDISETIALTLNYQLSIVDEVLIDEEEETGFAPIIIFVIVICSLFGCILTLVGFYFVIKCTRRKRKTLIRMNNEIQFKRGDVFQKHPLKNSDAIKSSDGEKKHDDEGALAPLPSGAKLSNFLVSAEHLERMNK